MMNGRQHLNKIYKMETQKIKQDDKFQNVSKIYETNVCEVSHNVVKGGINGS